MLGSFFAMVITVFFYAVRKVLPFKESFACIPEGFKAMVPAILILTFCMDTQEYDRQLRVLKNM